MRLACLLGSAGALFLGTVTVATATRASATVPTIRVHGTTFPGVLPAGVHEHHGHDGEIDINACANPAPGRAHCLARLRIDAHAWDARPKGVPGAFATSTLGDGGAYSPAYLQSAYNAPSTTDGSGETVTIVDAYDDPNAESDLATYRSHYGLPPCTTANGCFSEGRRARRNVISDTRW